ncbi:MAG: hypothetical protein J6U02_00125 [Elusimicrobia bacterium]|nr:hypothetical protein [Elusimicrobiota bacterium]
MKINLSKIFRYILIILVNILCIFVLQYYVNLQTTVSKSLSDLKIAIFFDNSGLETNTNTETDVDTDNDNDNDVVSKISSNNKLKDIEIINSTDFDKFSEINSELDNTIPKESVSFPDFILANIINVNSINELESLKKEILSIEKVEDFVYDQKAYKMFFDNKQLLNKYEKIFKYIFFATILLFIMKFLFFMIKGLYKDTCLEIVSGLLLCLAAYAVICLVTIFYQDNIFILNGQILYILVPFSSMVTLLTKESNA